MSDFQGFYVDGSIDPKVQADAIACAIASTEDCYFHISSNVGTIVELAMFLKLAIDQKICDDSSLVEAVSCLRSGIISSIKSDYPCFETFDFSSYEKFISSKKMAHSVNVNPALAQMFDGIFQQLQQHLDCLDEE